MESVDYKGERESFEGSANAIIHSKTIRAGKRTYFFDVKSTRNGEYYLTITESKRKYDDNGNYHFEKHKVFLYPEDFEKFSSTLQDIFGYIHDNNSGFRQAEESAEFADESPDEEFE